MNEVATLPKLLLTAEEARQVLSMGESRFEELYRSGKLRVIRNGRRVLFSVEELNRYIRENQASYSA